MTNLKALGLALILATAPLLAACENEGPAEQAGEKIDESVEETNEAAEEAIKEMEEAAEEAREKLKDATN